MHDTLERTIYFWGDHVFIPCPYFYPLFFTLHFLGENEKVFTLHQCKIGER